VSNEQAALLLAAAKRPALMREVLDQERRSERCGHACDSAPRKAPTRCA
jgi:hypothetical protein